LATITAQISSTAAPSTIASMGRVVWAYRRCKDRFTILTVSAITIRCIDSILTISAVVADDGLSLGFA
jgi:hypothetical protein